MAVAFLAFAAAAGLLILLPGPDNALVVRNALLGGRPVGLRTAAGVLTGLLAWAAAAAAGLSALLAASRIGHDVVRCLGAAYLLWLGVAALRSRGRASLATDDQHGKQRRSATVGYLTGLVTNLLNPKVGIFMITFLPAFIPRGAPVGPTALLFGATFAVETAIWFAVLLWLVGRGTAWLQRPGVQRRMEQLTGLVLIGFGVRLATERP